MIKMNIDTDTQWAYWDGIRQFYKKNEGYLQGQVIRLCDDFLRQFPFFERETRQILKDSDNLIGRQCDKF